VFHPSVVRFCADLGEFSIRFVNACIDFVLINIGSQFFTSLINQGFTDSDFKVWLKVNMLPGSCSGNTAGRQVVFGFRSSTRLILGSGSCQTLLCNGVSRVDMNPTHRPELPTLHEINDLGTDIDMTTKN
jgi:hypothetical protein